jgi:hypothetical protein
MQHKFRYVILSGAMALALTGMSAAAQTKRGRRAPAPPAPPPAGVYTTTSGTIVQFNYNRDAMVEGFLLNDHTLVHLPPNVAGMVGPTLHANDSLEVAGYANTSANGMKTLEAQQIKDKTSGKTFTMAQPGPAAPYSGSGRIQQLNYAPDGSVNGFLMENGALAELPPFSASNPSSVKVGATVNFTGYARTSVTGRTVVDLQTLSINGQTMTIAASGPAAPGAPPRPPMAPAAPNGPGAEEPAPPPPPPAAPPQF